MLEIRQIAGEMAGILDAATGDAADARDDERSPAGADGAKRRQILDGHRRVFLAQGFDGASMGAIAKAAGVSKGTADVYFDSKQALCEGRIVEERRTLA